MDRPRQTAFFPAALRRTWPEWLAALALAWIFHDVPVLTVWHARRLAQTLPALRAEGRHRIPPSKTGELKGTWPAIQWINLHVPQEKRLLYVGRMGTGIRLRYYTFPRTGRWLYLYAAKDALQAPAVLREYAPDFVVLERGPGLKDFTPPENWREAWRLPTAGLVIYEVTDHAGE